MRKMFSMERERGVLLGRVVLIFASVGLLAYVPSLVASIEAGLVSLVVVTTVLYLLAIVIAFQPSIPFRVKLLTVVGSLFIVGFTVLITTGPYGAGDIWIMSGVLISALFGSVTVVVVTIGLSVVAMAGYGALARMGLLNYTFSEISLIVIGGSMVTICVALSYVIHASLGGMEETMAKHEVLTRELHHRVKNNLQVTLSLISLEAYGASPTPSIVALERRVRILTVVNELFLDSPDTLRIDVRAVARAVAGCAQQWTIVSDDGLGEKKQDGSFEIEADAAAHFAIGVGELLHLLSPSTVFIASLSGTASAPPRITLRLAPGSESERIEKIHDLISKDATVRSLLETLRFRPLAEDPSLGPGLEIDAAESVQ